MRKWASLGRKRTWEWVVLHQEGTIITTRTRALMMPRAEWVRRLEGGCGSLSAAPRGEEDGMG